MQTVWNLLARLSCAATVAGGVNLLGASSARGADPVIHAAWTEPGDPPALGFDYVVSTLPPASPSFPDVELITGSLTWQIWSTDTDNPNGIGDIGVISSPHPQNFAVRIEDDQDGPGAREVKGITLDPQGEGSDANYSDLIGGQITGNLSGDLTLQKSSGGSGGVAAFTIGGDVLGDMTIPDVSSVFVYGDVASGVTITIGNLVDAKELYFCGAEFAGTLFFPNGLDDYSSHVYVNALLTGTGSIDFNGHDLGCRLTLAYGASDGSVLTAGTMDGFVYVNADFEGTATFDTMSGTVEFEGADLTGTINVLGDWNGNLYMLACGVGTTGEIHVGGDLTETADIILVETEGVGGDWDGTLDVEGSAVTGSTTDIPGSLSGDLTISGEAGGEIDIGGDALGNIDLGELSGTMTVAGDFLSGGYYFTADDISGSLTVGGAALGDIYLGELSGTMSVTGDLLSSGHYFTADGDISGSLTVGGNALGYVSLGELSGTMSVTGDIDGDVYIYTSSSGTISAGAVPGYVEFTAGTYSGTATFGSVSGYVLAMTASVSGTIHVTGDVSGSVGALNYGNSGPGLTETGLIWIEGNLSGYVQVWQDAAGDIWIDGDITSTGEVYVQDDVSGELTVYGDAGGEITIGGDALGNIDLSKLTGSVTITGDVHWLMITESSSGTVTAAAAGLVKLAQGGGNIYSGTATFGSVSGYVLAMTASVSGTIHVTGDVSGTVAAMAISQVGQVDDLPSPFASIYQRRVEAVAI